MIKVEIAFMNQTSQTLRFDDFVLRTSVKVLKIIIALVNHSSHAFCLNDFVMRSLRHNIVVRTLCLLEPICIFKVLNLVLL